MSSIFPDYRVRQGKPGVDGKIFERKDARRMIEQANFTDKNWRPRPALIVLIVLLHLIVLYGLAKALAPDITGSIEDEIESAFVSTVITPDEPPPPAESGPGGAAGDPGKEAVPKPETAPETIFKRDPPIPEASSTGDAVTSGAREEGEETGAAGNGAGTGSGRGGDGQGGGAVTKPVHISGGINAALDYPIPPGGRAARIGTSVIVKVIVGVNGRASNCSIYQASPDRETDRITCQLVVDRLRFEPATNAAGRPVPAPFYWQQRFF